MKKYIILSVNRNVDYMYFMPLTIWSWRKAGFEPLCTYVGRTDELTDLIFKSADDVTIFKEIEGIREATIAQVSRLYVSCRPSLNDDDYLMLGDVDMLALGDHWINDTSKVTVYNHDLTEFTEIPMCYVGAPVNLWRNIMKLNGSFDWNDCLKRDIENYPNAKDPDFYKWWGCDQQILTQRLNEYGKEKITFINRGQYPNGFAKGRVDRGDWHLNHDQFIDAHLMQQVHHKEEKIDTLMQLLRYNWPDEDFAWFEKYTEEFKKLAV
jgi:hypothetical protein